MLSVPGVWSATPSITAGLDPRNGHAVQAAYQSKELNALALISRLVVSGMQVSSQRWGAGSCIDCSIKGSFISVTWMSSDSVRERLTRACGHDPVECLEASHEFASGARDLDALFLGGSAVADERLKLFSAAIHRRVAHRQFTITQAYPRTISSCQ